MTHPRNKAPRGPWLRASLLLALAVGATCGARAFDFGGANDITAVSGRASKDYVRARLADGSFAPETYAFGEGGVWPGDMPDASIDKLKFLDVARMVANPLASQKYMPSREEATTRLLIMVYWGTTHAPEQGSGSNATVNLQAANDALANATMEVRGMSLGVAAAVKGAADDALTTAMAMAAAENRMRDHDDLLNAKMLGYDSWWTKTQGDHRGTALDQSRKDLFAEIEENRYFVVLMAYDFQLIWKEKKHKLLWETRFSIRQHHHDFDKDLPTMAQYASRYFGQDSNGLVHEEIPLGHVDIGEMKSLGEVPDK